MHARSLSAEESLSQDFEALSVSKRLAKNVSQKLKKKNHKGEVEEDDITKGISMNCLSLYSRSGGCKVSADTSDDFGDPSSRRRSNASEEGKGHKTICGTEDTGIDCFSHAIKEKFWKKNTRKYLEFKRPAVQSSTMDYFLPDDILEMCLMRLPMTSLMNARLVCKKWKYLSTTVRFMQLRRNGSHQTPWMFLFGAVRDSYCSGEIHAFDVSQDQWHKIDSNIIKGRFMFAVASTEDEVYIVGGCSSLSNFGRVDRSSFKTHKGVLVFNPLTKSWRKSAPMRYARSMPVLGVSEVGSDFCSVQSRQDMRLSRSRTGGASEVYEDPHRLSLRRTYRNNVLQESTSFSPTRKQSKSIKKKLDQHITIPSKRFVLIAVGGYGLSNEPLDSGEIYDSASNKWTEIQKLPNNFGFVCSGVFCNGIFYVYSETDKLAGYDIAKGSWVGIQTHLFPLHVHDYHPKLVSCNNRLFMLSVSWCEGEGQIGQRNKAVRKLWELDLLNLLWTEVCVHPDAPMDWNAEFVADRNFVFGVEMFKIFGQVLNFFTVCDVSSTGATWRHVSRNHEGHELDAASCMTKSVAVLHL